MRRACLIAVLLVGIVSFLSLAQTTLTFTSALPFDLSGFGDLSFEGSWQWQRAPWTVGASATLTPKSFEGAKLSLSYQISQIQASANATLSLEGLKSAETQLKAELSGLISFENTLSFSRRGFKNGKVAVKLGPSALNISGSAQLTPEGIAAPSGAVNFSLSQELGRSLRDDELFGSRLQGADALGCGLSERSVDADYDVAADAQGI
jgi:hypothetical protein